MAGCGLALGGYTLWDLFVLGGDGGERAAFRNSAPAMLPPNAQPALWYESTALSDGPKVHCTLCPHECLLAENDRGFCRTRVVKDGKLYTLAYGNPCAAHLDPIEKKPLNHFLPGTLIFSLATAGCNMRCLNCQNWEISQSTPEETTNFDLAPQAAVEATKRYQAPALAYTYSEPVIFYEYVCDTAAKAREAGLKNVLVTAAFINSKPLKQPCKVIDGAHVDLKSFEESFYRKIASTRLKPVLDAITTLRECGVWIEITRLMVPALSDSIEDITAMARWMVRNLGADVPLHLLRFHPAHKLLNLPLTAIARMQAAKQAALAEGLHYVYLGNVPGAALQETKCPRCGRTVIKRDGYQLLENVLKEGRCPCGENIAGVWS
jgi:pyruvate formate lyase activating enzyme